MAFTQIPCSHDYYPSGKQIDVLFKYRVFDRCTFVAGDGDTRIVTPFYPYNNGAETILSINPYCPDCKTELYALYASMTHSEEEWSDMLKLARDEIEAVVPRLLEVPDFADDDYLGSLHISVDFYRSVILDYDEESVREWIERVSFTSEEGPNCIPASKEAIDALERITTATTSTTTTNTTSTCAICLEELFVTKDKVGRRLPCKHEFHEDCILKWLHTSHYCPLCRFELPTSSSSLSSSIDIES